MEPIYDNPNNHKHNKSTYVFLNLLTALLPFSKPEMIYLSVKMTELFGQCKCVHTSCIHKLYTTAIYFVSLQKTMAYFSKKELKVIRIVLGGPSEPLPPLTTLEQINVLLALWSGILKHHSNFF